MKQAECGGVSGLVGAGAIAVCIVNRAKKRH